MAADDAVPAAHSLRPERRIIARQRKSALFYSIMSLSLTGKVALVTGSTSGIGRGVALAFAKAGCKVVVNGFGDASAVASLLQELKTPAGGEAIHVAANLAKPDEIAELMKQAEARWGRLDILVNNAGLQSVAPLEAFSAEKWDELIAVNLSAAFHTTRAALPAMRRQGWGRILNVASAHGLVASPGKSAYVAAKHGLIGLTKVTALETARDHITCNAICPGYVRTPLVENQLAEQARLTGKPLERVIDDVILAKQPTGEFITVEQVAGLALFLCSDAAAGITGSALPIDGGWTAT